MVIHNVWILEKKSGILLFHEKLGSIEAEEDLLSGFLSAIYSFAESEIGAKGIASMEMDEYNMIYCLSHGLLFVMAADKDDEVPELRAHINLIKDYFLDEFPDLEKDWERFLSKWGGDRDRFRKFQTPLRDLINSWVEVDATTFVAEKMDLLEVYQQLFSRIAKLSLPLLKKGKIKKRLEETLEETIRAHQSVLNVEDLTTIYNSEETFLDVLSVNVLNPELSVVTIKATLADLCSATLRTLRNAMGDKKFGEEFRTHVLPYLKQDWDRIRGLGLDKLFLSYIA